MNRQSFLLAIALAVFTNCPYVNAQGQKSYWLGAPIVPGKYEFKTEMPSVVFNELNRTNPASKTGPGYKLYELIVAWDIKGSNPSKSGQIRVGPVTNTRWNSAAYNEIKSIGPFLMSHKDITPLPPRNAPHVYDQLKLYIVEMESKPAANFRLTLPGDGGSSGGSKPQNSVAEGTLVSKVLLNATDRAFNIAISNKNWAGWITGDAAGKKLRLHYVDADLNAKMTPLALGQVGASTPFDASLAEVWLQPDDSGVNNLRMPPAIIGHVSGNTLTVCWRDRTQDKPKVYVSRYTLSLSNDTISAQLNWTKSAGMEEIFYLAGFTCDNAGNSYVLRAQREDGQLQAKTAYDSGNIMVDRKNILRINKLDTQGKQVEDWPKDVGKSGGTAFAIFGPLGVRRDMWEGSPLLKKPGLNVTNNAQSAMVFAGGKLYIHYGASLWDNTGWHQNSYYRVLETSGAAVHDANGGGVGHSKDLRLLVDGNQVVALESSDDGAILKKTYPKTVGNSWAFPHDCASQDMFTELGDIVKVESNYLVLVSSTKTAQNQKGWANGAGMARKKLNGGEHQAEFKKAPNLAIVRIKSAFSDVSTNSTFGKPMKDINLGPVWLTNYANDGKRAASRPKLVRLSDSSLVVIWSDWVRKDSNSRDWTFDSTRAKVIDSSGNVKK